MSKKTLDDELVDQCRIVDMMLSMHARQGNWLNSLATTFDIIQLLAAAVLVSTSFFDSGVWAWMGLAWLDLNRVAGVASIILLAMAIFALRLNWANRAGAHHRATETLAKLKSQLRWLRDRSDKADAVKQDELTAIQAILVELPPIPPRRFHRLKAHHLRKVAVSKMLDKFPGAPVWLLRLRLFLRDVVSSIRPSNPHGDKNAKRG